jgi:hypothetical protein
MRQKPGFQTGKRILRMKQAGVKLAITSFLLTIAGLFGLRFGENTDNAGRRILNQHFESDIKRNPFFVFHFHEILFCRKSIGVCFAFAEIHIRIFQPVVNVFQGQVMAIQEAFFFVHYGHAAALKQFDNACVWHPAKTFALPQCKIKYKAANGNPDEVQACPLPEFGFVHTYRSECGHQQVNVFRGQAEQFAQVLVGENSVVKIHTMAHTHVGAKHICYATFFTHID